MFKILKQKDFNNQNFIVLKSAELSRLVGGMNGKVKWFQGVPVIDETETEDEPSGMNNGTVKFGQ